MLNFDELKQQITQEVASGVVAKLPEEAKQHIIAEAMKKVINDYDFKQAVEEQLKKESKQRIDELLANVKFDEELTARFQEGVDLFMQTLPKAIAAAMVGTLVGPNRYKTGAVYQGLCELLRLDPDK